MMQTTAEADRGDPLEAFVHSQAARLWRGYQADRADVVAELARLRRGLPHAKVMPVESWEIFARGFPQQLQGHEDEPSPSELAAAAALALFALHQQSRRTASMHHHGRDHGVGRAARVLQARVDSGGVERRMQALIRANDLDPILEHLRGLVTQLRTHEIALDYAALARNLCAVQHPMGRRSVRVRWSRDFYQLVAGQSGDPDQIAGETA